MQEENPQARCNGRILTLPPERRPPARRRSLRTATNAVPEAGAPPVMRRRWGQYHAPSRQGHLAFGFGDSFGIFHSGFDIIQSLLRSRTAAIGAFERAP